MDTLAFIRLVFVVAQSYDVAQYEDRDKDSDEEEEDRWARQSESGSSRDSGGEGTLLSLTLIYCTFLFSEPVILVWDEQQE